MVGRRSKIIFFLSGVVFYLIAGSEAGIAQNIFFANANLQVVGGKFTDGSQHISTFIYGGLRYQAQRFNLNVNIPLVFTGTESFTQVGGMYLPNGKGQDDIGSTWHGQSHGSMMGNSSDIISSSVNTGIGDLYMYGSYKVILQENALPEISLDGYIKFPTATSSLNIGTGEYDFNIAVSVRKSFGRFLIYMQTGYLFLGETEDSNITNPVIFSIGAGSFLGSGNHALFIGYDSYSTIVTGFDSPKQFSIGYSYIVSPALSYNFITSFGLNNSTSDFSLSGGISYGI